MFFIFFFFNDTATTEIYTLSLHDALPISVAEVISFYIFADHGEAYDLREIALTDSFLLQSLLTLFAGALLLGGMVGLYLRQRSEEHTSELQSRQYLVCRLLLEKKKIK